MPQLIQLAVHHLLPHHVGTFVRITCAQNVQIIFRFIELAAGFYKPGVNGLVRRMRRIPRLPVPQHTGVIGQNRKAQPLVFHELLCFCSDALCVERRCAGRFIRAEMKICHQLPCRIIRRKLKQSAYKVDYVSVLPAGEAIKMIVRHIQAGVPVIVERAEGFALPIDRYPIPFRSFPAVHAIFDVLKKVHAVSSVK